LLKRDELRQRALQELITQEVLMVDGHFDFGNGYHGPVYLNPHRIFRQPSLIWRFAQDVISILPEPLVSDTEVVVGPVLGGALFAHTLAGMMDGKRALTRPATSFAPLSLDTAGGLMFRPFYKTVVAGKRVLLADDVRNTGKPFERAAAVVQAAGGTVIGSVEICDRLEAVVELDVPNVALAEYHAPDNFLAAECPLCQAGTPITTF
jgi:orotate phosphoribosyltransferase